jgi:hypothetical protein
VGIIDQPARIRYYQHGIATYESPADGVQQPQPNTGWGRGDTGHRRAVVYGPGGPIEVIGGLLAAGYELLRVRAPNARPRRRGDAVGR